MMNSLINNCTSLPLEACCTCQSVQDLTSHAYAVSTLTRFSSEPTKQHWTAVKHVMRYLKGKVNYDIHYRKKSYKNVFATLMQTGQETLMIEDQHLPIYFKSVVELLLGAIRNNHLLLC